MAQLNNWFSTVFILLLLFSGNLARADIVLLNPATLRVGTTLGENLVVKTDPPTGKNYITSTGEGKLGKIELPVNLAVATGFKLKVLIDQAADYQIITLYSASSNEDEQLEMHLHASRSNIERVAFAGAVSELMGGKNINRLELFAKESIVLLGVNEKVHPAKFDLLNPNLVYTKLVISQLNNEDRLFEVSVKELKLSTDTK